MVLKGVLAAVFGAAILAAGSAQAEEYRADEFLALDLSKAAFSPKPLGPPARFGPMRVEAKSDSQSKTVHVDARPSYVDAVRKPAPRAAKIRAEHARAEKPRPVAPPKVVRRHSNPLDAQASDTRIQVWPCRSGGICSWKR